ncbi:MAG TPA: YegP family protein, partial [Mycobacterium sp.]
MAVGSRAKGKFRFRLKAGDGEIIAVGEAYESKASAKKGIASVQTNAADRE